MAKCLHCRQRKAKRYCPALGGDLCALCCGQYRNREFRCPSGCPHLARHSPYQEQRSPEKKPEEDILQEDRLVWLAYSIETPLKIVADRIPSFEDDDAVRALEYARDKLARSRRLLLFPGEALRPRDEAGEAVFQSLERCRFERTIIIPGSEAVYSQEEKLKVLDFLLRVARSHVQSVPGGRSYLEQLQERHRRAEEMMNSQKLITPS